MTQDDDLDAWYESYRAIIEGAYLGPSEPWRGSGFSGPYERWVHMRMPIADCVDRSGSFLDIGCANGYLLESLIEWKGAQGIHLDPHGLDLSPELVKLARERLPEHADQMHVGNGLDWIAPRRYDFVRTELCYAPLDYHRSYVERLLRDFLTDEGALIVAEYRGRSSVQIPMPVDDWLRELGFTVESIRATDDPRDGLEKVRVAVVRAGT